MVEIVDNEASKEHTTIFKRWLIYDNIGALGLDTLHDALNGRLAEVVGVGLHSEAVETDYN